jgi:hypothetical protein
MSQTEPEAADQVLQWVMLLQGHVDEYGGQLSLTDFDSYQAELNQIAGLLRDHPDQAAQCRTNLIELVSRYPSVGQWLCGVDPVYRDLPGVNEPPSVEPDANPAEAEATPVEPAEPAATSRSRPAKSAPPAGSPPADSLPVNGDDGNGDNGDDGNGDEGEAPEASPPATRSRPGRRPAAPAKRAPAGRSWSPEVVLQVGKEVVTAIIALVIIGSTVALVARSFGLIGNAGHITQAKDLLTIMLGLAGAVLGYYFGRVPAEARATTATVRADQATTEKENLKAKTRSAANDLDRVIARTAAASATRGGGAPVPTRDDLQAIRDSLREISF